MKLMDLISEAIHRKHEFGCVMLHFDYPEIYKMQDIIDPDDIYTDPKDSSYGLETEFYVTLLFGLHKEVKDVDVKGVLSDITFDKLRLINPSVFENEFYDVLKFEVTYATRGGAFLHKANREFKKFPHTSDFPDYNPHVTIAYLKPGKGKKYAKILASKIDDIVVTPKYAIYSKVDGTREKLKINVRK